MGRSLRALLVEDSEDDAASLLRELRCGDFDVQHARVETAEAMGAALHEQSWDIIFCGFSLRSFDLWSALALVRSCRLDLPFMVISSALVEQSAIEAMRAGVHDYFVKGRLAPRLVPAVERELRGAALRLERKQLEQQLFTADRMACLGTLAAGMAHEVNNPLSAVLVNLELAAQGIRDCVQRLGLAADLAEVWQELHDARESAVRIRSIVRDLKFFSRADGGERSLVDVQKVLESTLRMARNEIRHRARLCTDFAAVPLVEASESRLGQVFLNLLINAAQAVRESSAGSHEIRVSTRSEAGGRVVIEVSDTGPGMSAAVLSRLFTPFFTTKPAGVGTGLGLSICNRIVTELGGTIGAESREGRGTTFRVVLPAARPGGSAELGAEAGARCGRGLLLDEESRLPPGSARVLS
jgi:signal transduction histidine kinase